MRIRMYNILYGLLAITVVGVQLQDVLLLFSPTVNKTIGAGMAAVLVMILLNNKNSVREVLNTEMMLWVSFLLWSGITGVFTAHYESTFVNMMSYLAQQTLVVMAAILVTVMCNSINRVLYVIFIIPLIFILYLFMSGQGYYILSLTTDNKSNFLGVLINPNTIAFWNMNGIISYMIFRPSLRKKGSKKFCLPIAILYFYVIIQTGSRKTFLAVILFLVLAYLFNQVFVKKNSAVKVVAILLIVTMTYIFAEFILPEIIKNTYLGQRLINFSGDSSNEKRIEMIFEALEHFKESPIWGIGINQFQHYTVYGYYTHCDIAEVLCSTGIIGGLLYVSIYILCLRKLLLIWKQYRSSGDIRYKQTGTILAGLIALIAISVGSVSFESMTHWLSMSVIIGYTKICGKEDTLKRKAGVII